MLLTYVMDVCIFAIYARLYVCRYMCICNKNVLFHYARSAVGKVQLKHHCTKLHVGHADHRLQNHAFCRTSLAAKTIRFFGLQAEAEAMDLEISYMEKLELPVTATVVAKALVRAQGSDLVELLAILAWGDAWVGLEGVDLGSAYSEPQKVGTWV